MSFVDSPIKVDASKFYPFSLLLGIALLAIGAVMASLTILAPHFDTINLVGAIVWSLLAVGESFLTIWSYNEWRKAHKKREHTSQQRLEAEVALKQAQKAKIEADIALRRAQQDKVRLETEVKKFKVEAAQTLTTIKRLLK
jgi:thiol:disulfide interchange protein